MLESAKALYQSYLKEDMENSEFRRIKQAGWRISDLPGRKRSSLNCFLCGTARMKKLMKAERK